MPISESGIFKRRHFVAIQNALRETVMGLDGSEYEGAKAIIEDLAGLFQKENTQFRKHAFIISCGIVTEENKTP